MAILIGQADFRLRFHVATDASVLSSLKLNGEHPWISNVTIIPRIVDASWSP